MPSPRLIALPRARGVDEDAPHHPRRGRKEVRAILPVNTAPVEQPQIGLLDELGWTPAAVPALVGQEPARDHTQVLVDDRREHRERVAVPLTPGLKQPCQIPVARHVGRSVTRSPSGLICPRLAGYRRVERPKVHESGAPTVGRHDPRCGRSDGAGGRGKTVDKRPDI